MSTIAPPADFLAYPLLNADQRKGRYGVAYLRLIAGQAGCTVVENDPDEDVQAIDAKVGFDAGDVFVQVKTTHQHSLGGSTTIGYTAKPHWIERWSRLRVPVYFVVVVVPEDSSSWLGHVSSGTQIVDTAAYWTRIDPVALQKSPRIHVPRNQRLEAGVLADWEAAFNKDFVGGKS